MLIIHIDDDIDDREMFHDAIELIDAGITCFQFENCSKAIEFVTKSKILPDLMFIDINMPKMNGYECVDRMREIADKQNIAIVMLSTAFNPAQQTNSTNSELRYLKKSTRLSELVQAIKDILLELFTVSAER